MGIKVIKFSLIGFFILALFSMLRMAAIEDKRMYKANRKWAKADYNMSFKDKHFIKGCIYEFSYNRDKAKVYVTTEEGKKQEFWLSEFNHFFTLV